MNIDFHGQLKAELGELEGRGLYRSPKALEGATGAKAAIDGREYLLFCSNNYLGLASDPRVMEAARNATVKYGWGSGASRLISGSQRLHRQLEQALAELKETPAAALFPTGYMANVGAIAALTSAQDTIIVDRLCHASIIDGCRMSRAKLQVYEHNEPDSLRRALNRSGKYRRRLVITESVFSMDGDLAPLPDIVNLCRHYEAILMVDEAHATGVLGEHGRGALELFGLQGEVDIVMGTLSKAIGSIGGFIAGREPVVEYLRQKARSYIYTTALPAAACAAGLTGIKIIRDEPERRRKLWENVTYVKEGLKALGFELLGGQSQIIPALTGDEAATIRLSEHLFRQGIFIPGIRPPTVPKGRCRLRITPASTHTQDDLDTLLDAFRTATPI